MNLKERATLWLNRHSHNSETTPKGWEIPTEFHSERMADFTGDVMAEALVLAKEIEMYCPCGARPESLDKPDRHGNTYPHVGGCPVGKLIELLSRES